MANGVYFRGDKEIVGNVSAVRRGLPGEVGKALYAELDEVELPEVIQETPIDTGDLRSTERVDGPEVTPGGRIQCSIVAGGDNVDYAIKVHEDLDAFHRIGGAKYIERPLFESRPYIAARVAKRIDLRRLR